jgi:UDP-glucose 4-epimerase
MKKILITGASGFIGSHLVDEALRLGYDVVAGIRPTSSREFLADPRIRFITLDYGTPTTLAGQLQRERFNYIIHNAGTTGTKGQGDFLAANVEITKHLLQAIRESGALPETFLYISTLAAQGPGNPATMQPLQAGDAERPLSAYAKSKLMAERLVSSAGFPIVILRPTAVFGPRDRDFLNVLFLHRGSIAKCCP